MNANDQLSDDIVANAVTVEKLKRRTVQKMIALLAQADRDVIGAINSANITGYQARRINQLATRIREILRAAYIALGDDFKGELEDLVRSQIGITTKSLDDAVGIAWSAAPSVNQVYTAALARPFQGKLLRDSLKDQPDRTASLIRQQLRIGYLAGETQNQINARVNRKLKGTQRNELRTVVNTAYSHFQSFALRRVYDQNSDAISGLMLRATIDTDTTPICMSRDGKVYKPSEAPHLPFHYNERSQYRAVLKRWQDQKFDVPERTRSSMDGQMPTSTTYKSWIARQSAARQDEALGRNRGRLLRGSDLSVDDLFGKDRLLLNAELQKKFPDQWAGVFGA